MDITEIKTLLNQELSRIKDPSKGNGKNVSLTISTTDGKELKLQTNNQDAFYKAPEILNGVLKIGVADPSLASSTTTDQGGVLSIKTKQPVTYYYIPVENIVSMHYDYEVITQNYAGATEEAGE